MQSTDVTKGQARKRQYGVHKEIGHYIVQNAHEPYIVSYMECTSLEIVLQPRFTHSQSSLSSMLHSKAISVVLIFSLVKLFCNCSLLSECLMKPEINDDLI